MTTWKEIGEDGPPRRGQWVWLYRKNQINSDTVLVWYYKSSHIGHDIRPKWKAAMFGSAIYLVELTDKWTPIVPPDPPEED